MLLTDTHLHAGYLHMADKRIKCCFDNVKKMIRPKNDFPVGSEYYQRINNVPYLPVYTEIQYGGCGYILTTDKSLSKVTATVVKIKHHVQSLCN